MKTNPSSIALCLLVVAAPGPVVAQVGGAESEVRAAVEAFDRALAGGDSAAVLALLHADASVHEGGVAETREQYRAGHLRGDIAFLREVTSETVRDRVAKLKAEGKTKEQAIAARPTVDLDEQWGKGFIKGDAIVGFTYDTLP